MPTPPRYEPPASVLAQIRREQARIWASGFLGGVAASIASAVVWAVLS